MLDLPLSPLSWHSQDRRRLYRSLRVLTSNNATPMRMGVARHALLVDLEIYDDPRQGAGWWIFPDEIALLNDLGVALAEDISDAFDNRNVREIARALRRLLEANGAGMPFGRRPS